jgi:hypothetical protein
MNATKEKLQKSTKDSKAKQQEVETLTLEIGTPLSLSLKEILPFLIGTFHLDEMQSELASSNEQLKSMEETISSLKIQVEAKEEEVAKKKVLLSLFLSLSLISHLFFFSSRLLVGV